MAIRTSAITYSRGVPKTTPNFFYSAQANNVIVVPISKYLRNYQFYNRNVTNTNISGRWPWNN